MRRRFSLNGLIVGVAVAAALLLTVYRQSPEGLLTFGLGDREVRAAPGAPAASVKPKHNLTSLKVFNLALVRIRDSYVDPSRIDPKKMLFAALDSVQFNIPEVLVEAYPERDEAVVVVNDKRETFSTAEVDSPWRLSSKLKDIFRFIQANMNPGADLAQVEYAAVNGMLSTLDPHSVLLDPESAKEMDISTSGHFGGLGIVIGMRKGNLTVIRPMPGTPAAQAGIKAGDHIFRINEEPTEHLTLNAAVDRMRGQEGTKVVIWVKRKGADKDLRFEITRGRISVPSVEATLLSRNVGYLRIRQFSGQTTQELKGHMAELRGKGATAWVLDLRRNPGGLLEEAIQVANVFVDRGTIVTTVGGRERDARRANKKGTTDTTSPVAVLVNGQSASASEIVAGAIKNLDRGVIIGSTTFGKGSVQILYDNKDGSKLKLTIAEYLTPGDLSIQSLGVPPDIELLRMYVPKVIKTPADQVRLLRTKHTFREKDLSSHLTSKHAKGGPGPTESVSYLYEARIAQEPPLDGDPEIAPSPIDEEEEAEEISDSDEFVLDYEIELARDLLAQARSSHRSKMLEDAAKFLAKRRAAEQKKVADALAVLGIDWAAPERTAPSSGAKLVASVAVTTADGAALPDGRVHAGDTIKLTGVVENRGTDPAYQVHARLATDDRIFDETELAFGRIEPGQSRTATTLLKIPEDALDRLDPIAFVFDELQGATAAVDPLRLRVVAKPRPLFAYTHHLIDDGNGDGLVQQGEPMRLRVTFKNIGAGAAHDTTAILGNKSGGNIDGVVIKKGRFQFPEGLRPGEQRTVEFQLDTNDKFNRDDLVLELVVYDAVLRETVAEKLKYAIHPDAAGPDRQSGLVRVVKADATLHEGADAGSSRIGTAGKGAVLAVTGKQGDFVRVDLGDEGPAFITADAIKRVKDERKSGGFDLHWQVTPPSVALQVPTHETQGATYRLQGEAKDDTHVEDVYIFVSNRDAKIDNKKVFYRSNRGSSRESALAFSHDIPLWLGSNLVTVVARENDDVQSIQFLYIHRSAVTTTADARTR
jgi:carboxyl-terminal processing protease